MITTNTGAEGNFYVTAKTPAGPWSDPVFIEARGIDPDLFFDDDGKANEEASMILLNNGAHFDLLIKQSGGKRVLVSKLRFGSIVHESDEIALKPGQVKLIIKGERANFTLLYAQGNDTPKEIIKVMSRYLSSETVGGFTGVYVGL